MTKCAVDISAQEAEMVERAVVEGAAIENILDFFIKEAVVNNANGMLADTISRYERELAQIQMRKDMLCRTIMRKYIPDGWDKEKSRYTILFNERVIVYETDAE